MDDLPTWVAVLVSFGTLILAGAAAYFSRRASDLLAESARKTEHGVNFRWACDHIASEETRGQLIGVVNLVWMQEAGTLDREEKLRLLRMGEALLRERDDS